MGSVRYLFLILAICRFIYYNKIGYFNRKMMKWSNSFSVKMITCILMAINYASMAFMFQYLFGNYCYLFLINSLVWIISTSLLYFEYRRKLIQSWLGLRLFWMLNGISYLLKMIFIFGYYSETKVYNKLNFLYLIQSVLSIILLYYSLFLPKDYGVYHNNIESPIYVENTEHDLKKTSHSHLDSSVDNGRILTDAITISKVEGKINHIHDFYNKIKPPRIKMSQPPLLKISISEIFSRKFSYTYQSQSQSSKNNKIRFLVNIGIPKKNNRFKIEERKFNSKRSINDVIVFNNQILQILENKINYVSPLKIQLKNINEIFNKYCILRENYVINDDTFDRLNKKCTDKDTFTNDLNRKRSFSNNISGGKNLLKMNSLKSLENIYVNLCRNFTFFIPEFLKFLDITETDLIENLLQYLENMNANFNFNNKPLTMIAEGDETYSIEKNDSHRKSHSSNKNQNIVEKDKSNKAIIKKDEDFYSEIGTKSPISNDLIKTMILINNVITNKNYIEMEMKKVREEINLTDIIYECQFLINFNDKDTQSISINLSHMRLLNLFELKKFSNCNNISELKQILTDQNSIDKLKNQESNLNKKFTNLITEILNDLFYYDNEFFQTFKINKLMNLDINELDGVILNSFFELERRSSLNVHLQEPHILKQKNILNYGLVCEFDRIENVETHNNSFYLEIFFKMTAVNLFKSQSSKKDSADNEVLCSTHNGDNFFSWDINFYLLDIKNLFNDLIKMNLNSKNFYELSLHLRNTNMIIDNLMKILTERKKSKSNGQSTNFAVDSDKKNDRVSVVSVKSKEPKTEKITPVINELVQNINALFKTPYLYILYSAPFRSIFNIHLIFDKKVSNLCNGMEMVDTEFLVHSSSRSILDNLLD